MAQVKYVILCSDGTSYDLPSDAPVMEWGKASEWKDHKLDYDSADRASALAFDAYGIDVTGLPVEEAAARIRARPEIATALVTAVGYWSVARRQKDKAGGLVLTAVAEAAESDPWRRNMREADKQEDKKRWRRWRPRRTHCASRPPSCKCWR
jgi:hypothetical protein